MNKKPKLNKVHNKQNKYYFVGGEKSWSHEPPFVEYEYLTEFGDGEVIYSATIKINTKTKKGRQLINKVITKQSSPIKMYLQEYDNANRQYKEYGKPYDSYEIPKELKDIIEEEKKKYKRY